MVGGYAKFTLFRPGKPDKQWLVYIPAYGEPGFYRQVSSLNWFRERESKRAWGDGRWDGPKIVHCSVDHDWERTLKIMKKHGAKVKFDPPKVGSIFEFYELVGYDRVKKKWTDKVHTV